MFKVTLLMLLLGHWMCCAWYFVGSANTDELGTGS
jgi:hypothetical protein